MEPILMCCPWAIWHTCAERVFAQLPEPERLSFPKTATRTTTTESYDNYNFVTYPDIGFISPLYCKILLEEQADGKRGALRTDGTENVFRFQGAKMEQFALRASFKRDTFRGRMLWHLVIHQIPNPNVYPGWGAYRPAGTVYCWDMNYGR